MNSPAKRLPCRGCLVSCKNYDRCEGRLWRLGEAKPVASDSNIKKAISEK